MLSADLVISRCGQDSASLKVNGTAKGCRAQQNNGTAYEYTPGNSRPLEQNL